METYLYWLWGICGVLAILTVIDAFMKDDEEALEGFIWLAMPIPFALLIGFRFSFVLVLGIFSPLAAVMIIGFLRYILK